MDDEYRWHRHEVWHEFPGLKYTYNSEDAVSFCYYNDGDADGDDHDHDHDNDDDDLSWERTQGGLQERGSDFPLLRSSSDPSSAGSKAGHSQSCVWKITNILSFKKVALLASLTIPQAAIVGSKWKLRHKKVRKNYW